MMDLTSMDVSGFASLQYPCECGHTHKVPIRHIYTGTGALDRLADVLKDFQGKKVFLCGDANTFPLAEKRVKELLAEADCQVEEYIFTTPKVLSLTEELIGRMLVKFNSKTDLLLSIGSGTINDLSRVISEKTGIPYVIIGTAPSMDGYASSVSPIVMEGEKRSVELCTPYGIIADSSIMATAPQVMLSSGAGDILGKYTALADWELARDNIGEYYCPTIASLVSRALESCTKAMETISKREESTIKNMADTLIFSGLAISMYGKSRPASGCEHQLAHYWEVDSIKRGDNSLLHGNYVGAGTKVALRMYQLANDEFGLNAKLPTPEWAAEKLDGLGDYTQLESLRISPELFYESFFHATHANGRYTLVSYLGEKGRLEAYARRLTDEFFG